jgi:hypothetical protein
MFPGAYILFALSQAPPSVQVQTLVSGDVVQLSWADAEERLRGSIRPVRPRVGEELAVSLHVGTFEGSEFDGPITVTLRRAGETHGQTVTLRREGQVWATTFVAKDDGRHSLDISFRTTRHKLVHADVEVVPSALSRLPWLLVGGALALALLAWGARLALRGREASGAPP